MLRVELNDSAKCFRFVVIELARLLPLEVCSPKFGSKLFNLWLMTKRNFSSVASCKTLDKTNKNRKENEIEINKKPNNSEIIKELTL